MPPANTNNTPAPNPPKEGFFSKLTGLFSKKAETTPNADLQRTSLTPEPHLDNGPADTAETTPNVQPDQTPPSLQVPPEVNAADPTPPVTPTPAQTVVPTPAAPQPVVQAGPQPSPFDTPTTTPSPAQPAAPAPGVPQMPPMPERPAQPGQPQPPVQ